MKKDVYTLYEIADILFEKFPGRYKNIQSARACVRGTARALGVGDINGKGRYKLIARVDAVKVIEEISGLKRRNRGGKGQTDLFEIFPELAPEDYEAPKVEAPKVVTLPYKPNTPEPEPITSAEIPTDKVLKRLETAAGILEDALRVFLDCLLLLERGRE